MFEYPSNVSRVAKFNPGRKWNFPEFIYYFRLYRLQIFVTFYLSHKIDESIFYQDVYKVLDDSNSKLVLLLVLP